MKLVLLVSLLILLSSCSVKAYKMIYELQPKTGLLCYYKKVSDIEQEKVKCYKPDAKEKNGTYKFSDTLVIKKRLFREVLNKAVNDVFGE